VAEVRLPTLIKYVDRVEYLEETARRLEAAARAVPCETGAAGEWCRLVGSDADGEERVLAAALYRFGEFSFERAREAVRAAGAEGRAKLADDLLGARGRHDIPLRELEYAAYTIDITLDQGGYFELKRHRMMTQTVQPLTASLGYALPRRMVEAGMESAYRAAMDAARRGYERLAEIFPAAASYVVPNGYNRRVLLATNLRSAMHLVNLRAAPNAHFSMRRAAQRIAEEIRAASPLLGRYVDVNPAETWQQVESDHFSATAVFAECD
jgi:hypothetical protein